MVYIFPTLFSHVPEHRDTFLHVSYLFIFIYTYTHLIYFCIVCFCFGLWQSSAHSSCWPQNSMVGRESSPLNNMGVRGSDLTPLLQQSQKSTCNFLKNHHLRICLSILEREEGGWRGRERHLLVTSHMCPDQGSNLQPRYVPQPGIEPATF